MVRLVDTRSADAVCQAVTDLARRCRYEEKHTEQVTRLALVLFDQLQTVHQLPPADRDLLRYGAMLHDIGWIEGQQAHHKTAVRIIMAALELPLNGRARKIVALIARYHRKALPNGKHALYADLTEADQKRVALLGGLLRLADGLDRTHGSVVKDIVAEITAAEVRLLCRTTAGAVMEQRTATEKSDLLEKALGRKVIIEMGRGE
jgi:exopolyphosphatase/pppGpp-phosphohydrolase